MAYAYEVDFDLNPEQMHQLEIGAALQRVLGYLKTLLPAEPGFITARAMHSLDNAEKISVAVVSLWDYWDDLTRHAQTHLAEDKVLKEFEPHVDLANLRLRIFQEVA
jgi:hypothetical protein